MIAASGHLRRRSSISQQPHPAQGSYNATTGEIELPTSPPLHAWRDHKQRNLSKRPLLPPSSRRPSTNFALPRPWISLLTLLAATLVFVILFTALAPFSAHSASSAILARIPFKSASTCEPYSAFGSLVADSSDPDKNHWVPFDSTCSPPGFLAQLRAERTTMDFSWLRNRTALVIGDSISREHVENFCILLGEESEVVRGSHKYSPTPSPIRATAKASHVLDKPARLAQRGFRVVRDASLPRICYIPQYDFLLASVFHFGLDQEDYWRESRMPQYAAPGMFEHRLSDVIQPLIANFRRDGRRTAPDFVEVSSGTWDLARWAEQDMEVAKDTEVGLTQDRVTWYRFRVGQMLEKVRSAFPNAASKTWRTLHYPADQAAEHDYFMDKIAPRSRAAPVVPDVLPPVFAHNRIYQLDQAVRSLIVPSTVGKVVSPAPHSDFRINEWGPILKGHEAHQKDRLHGQALPGSYIWGDIMLFELWKGVSRQH